MPKNCGQKWWQEAKFGMFIHWGLYSELAGEWNGVREPGIGEWIMKNQNIPVSWFSPPVYEHTAIQTFIEQLFGQREDPSAVMWTYRIYRRAHPGDDTSDAAQVAGYQSLKMNQTASAIALLEQNATDYPDKADAAFGLGGAYAAAGRKEEAKAQFLRALKLDPTHKRAQAALDALDAAQAQPR
jgi:tetratricopeptide (TPR) repeat protein